MELSSLMGFFFPCNIGQGIMISILNKQKIMFPDFSHHAIVVVVEPPRCWLYKVAILNCNENAAYVGCINSPEWDIGVVVGYLNV